MHFRNRLHFGRKYSRQFCQLWSECFDCRLQSEPFSGCDMRYWHRRNRSCLWFTHNVPPMGHTHKQPLWPVKVTNSHVLDLHWICGRRNGTESGRWCYSRFAIKPPPIQGIQKQPGQLSAFSIRRSLLVCFIPFWWLSSGELCKHINDISNCGVKHN
jgi:hypothetical protein